MRILALLGTASILLAPAQAFAADGAALYAKHCASCHGPDAKADTPAAKAMKVPAIAGHAADSVVAAVKENEKHKAPAGKLNDEELKAIGDFLASQ